MKWKEVIKNIDESKLHTVPDKTDITGISERSTDVEEGFVFVAIEGFETDGHAYISHAVEKGARVIIGEKPLSDLPVPYIQVSNSRRILGRLEANFYRHPSRDKLVFGVTGTNGKTTTALFLTHLLRKAGYTVSFFGTVFNEINGKRIESSLTTPRAPTIQRALAESNDQAAVIEVSSQGLDQYRMEGMAFDYALFTNLQHDHLDYHHTVEDYFKAKKKLFYLLKEKGKAVVNQQDAWGEKLAEQLEKDNISVLTVGEENQDTTYTVEDSYHGSCTIDDTTYSIQSPLPGKYNLTNLSMALTVLYDLGHDPDEMGEWLEDVPPVPGRFESYALTDNVEGIIDYAHTAEALNALLSTIQELHRHRHIVHIFGFRGNRDSTKREDMVRVSRKYSDQTILTLDDLNGVSRDAMEKEYTSHKNSCGPENIKIIMDRTRAISQTISEAAEPTLIVVTGKGHEPYQESFELPTESDKQTFQYLKEDT